MKDIFADAEECIMELGIVLSGYDLDKDLHREEVLNTIEAALKEAGRHFEKALCETGGISEECIKRVEELSNLTQMISVCATDKRISDAASVALIEFTYKIPQILSELKNAAL